MISPLVTTAAVAPISPFDRLLQLLRPLRLCRLWWLAYFFFPPRAQASGRRPKQMLAKLTALVITFFCLIDPLPSLAASRVNPHTSRCNTNDHCKVGWFCLDGEADKGDHDMMGHCQPNIVAKQLCTLHKSLVLVVGKFVVLFGAMLVGWSFLQGKVEIKSIITMVLGTILVVAPHSVVSLVTRKPDTGCEFAMTVDTKFLSI